ncbi:hypothetical protein PoB_006196000 [Plakobranchus ocellatus]|uniref:Uncharacterized protein n=1 Tax=Plakobranchus ocellatus TaxID=259542 RepID=A0AAV4CUC0_9GAST|nr:hypothetical protein PoB_006196000 [Plakobranchus ocellatus]
MDYIDVEHQMDLDIHSYACVTATDNEIDLSNLREQDMVVNHNGGAFELDVDLSAYETTKTLKKKETAHHAVCLTIIVYSVGYTMSIVSGVGAPVMEALLGCSVSSVDVVPQLEENVAARFYCLRCC